MASLTSCIKKAGKALRDEDRADILARFNALVEGGAKAAEAARQAVDEQIGKVQGLLGNRSGQTYPWETEPQGPLMAEERKDREYIPADQYRVLKREPGNLLPEEKRAFDAFLKGRPDAARIRARLKEHAGTPWALQAVEGIFVRRAMQMLLEGKTPNFQSSLDASKSWRDALLSGNIERVWQLAEADGGLMGAAGKPVNNVNSSFINCNPTADCAQYCYATKGHYRHAPSIVKSELVTMLVEVDPARAATRVAQEYKATAEFVAGKALRLFDKGDGDMAWLPFISELNRLGIRVQVFSKNPEFLREVPGINLRLLSIDDSNVKMADDNPDLPVAFVYSGKSQIDDLARLSERGQIQVVLPVKLGQKLLDGSEIQDIKRAIPKVKPYLCPIDSGFKPLGKTSQPGAWNCTKCDVNGGIGCFHGTPTKLAMQAARKPSKQVLASRIIELRRLINEAAAGNGNAGDGQRARPVGRGVAADGGNQPVVPAGLLRQVDDLLGDLLRSYEPGAEAGVDLQRDDRAPDAGQRPGEAVSGGRRVIPIKPDRGPGVANEPDAPYTTDLFGFDVEPPARARNAGAGRRQPAATPRNVVAAPALPPGRYAARSGLVETRRQKLGAATVRTLQDSANALAYLRKSSVERLDAIVTDDAGKPLAVIGGFKGALSQTSVYPTTLLGEALLVPGARKVWLVHNHPSGRAELSRADENLSQVLREVFSGTAISVEGMVAVAGDRWTGGVASRAFAGDSFGDLKPVDGAEVPAQERQIEQDGRLGPAIDSPATAKSTVKAMVDANMGRPTIVLMDAQNVPVAAIPWSAADAMPMRDNGKLDALLRAVAVSNAGSAIIGTGGPMTGTGSGLTYDQALNLGAGLAKMEVRVLDIIDRDGKSSAERGLPTKGGTLFSRQGTPRGTPVRDAESAVALIRQALPKAPPIIVIDDVRKAPERLLADIVAAGAENDVEAAYHDGNIYVFPEHIDSIERLMFVVGRHEIRHYGLDAMLGRRRGQVLLGIGMKNPTLMAAARQKVTDGYAKDVTQGIEEALADMPVSELEALSGWDRLVSAIRQWLRETAARLRAKGMTTLADAIDPKAWTDRDVADFVMRVEDVSRTGDSGRAVGGTMFQRDVALPPFYSALARVIDGAQSAAMSGDGWRQFLKGQVNKGAVKADELAWTGLEDWLGLQTGKVSREAVADFVRENGVKVTETVLSDFDVRQLPAGWDVVSNEDGEWAVRDENGEVVSEGDTREEAIENAQDEDAMPETAGAPKYANYQLPGGTNYREVLLTMPQKRVEQFAWTVERMREKRSQFIDDMGFAPEVVDQAIQYAEEAGSVEDGLRMADARVGSGVYKKGTKEARDMLRGLVVGAKKKNDAARLPVYKSNHWDQPNILAHIRVNDRTDADGKRVLFVEEIQSDWAQEGKKSGFKSDISPTTHEIVPMRTSSRSTEPGGYGIVRIGDPDQESSDIYGTRTEAEAALRAGGPEGGRLPRAPFVDKTDKWVSLALKRVIKMAVDEGYDRVAFVTGEQSAERYSLEKQVRRIEWTGGAGSTRNDKIVTVTPTTGNDIEMRVKPDGAVQSMGGGSNGEFDGKSLDQILGKDVAEKIMAERSGDLSGDGLKIGGKGMISFYDQIVPAVTKDVLKKVGGGAMETVRFASNDPTVGWSLNKTEAGNFEIIDPDGNLADMADTEAEGRRAIEHFSRGDNIGIGDIEGEGEFDPRAPKLQPGFTITPAMREKARGGLPMFSRRSDAQAQAKALGLPATGAGESIQRLVDIAQADPTTWTREDFDLIAPHLSVHQDLRPGAKDRIDAILSAGLSTGMVDSVGDMAGGKRWTWGKGLQGVPAYAFISGGLKYQAGGNPRLAPGNKPLFVITPEKGQDFYGALQTARRPAAATMFSRRAPQTESAAFKRWFGDSKVVDAEGKPLVVYHGTGAEFSVFDYSKIGQQGRSEGAGFYFTNSKQVASGYGAPMEVFLSIKNPLAYDAPGFSKPVVQKIVKRVAELEAQAEGSDIADGFLANFGDVRSDGLQSVVREAANMIAADETALDQLSGIVGSGVNPEFVNRATRDVTGHDGVVADGFSNVGGVDNRIFVAFFPEQIKSATGNNGNFDPQNPNTMFSRAPGLNMSRQQITRAARTTVADMLGGAGAKVGWWEKSIGTQYAKAKKHPDTYGAVFDRVQEYLEDTSTLANEAADAAPEILPKMETWGDFKRMGITAKDAKAVAGPIFQGTLDKVRYTEAELRSQFGLNDEQVEAYKQFFRAVNLSLDQIMAADVVRLLAQRNPALRDLALNDRAALRQGVEAYLEQQTQANPNDAELAELRDDIMGKYARIDQLKAEGYAPLMRFGKYAVTFRDRATGETLFFGLYETAAESNKAARELAEDPDLAAAEMTQGVLSQKQYEMFAAVPLDSLEMFAEALGAERSEVFQEYIRLAKNNRSALKRLLKRKGTAGYSQDARRVLASFVTSNARMASGALNLGDAKQVALDIRDGDVKDEAISLIENVQNPGETASWARAMLFTNFIGGSIASALVNLTQPLTMTLPWLTQFGGARKAASRLMAAGGMAASGKIDDQGLKDALKRAEEEGIVSPQEIHYLQAQAMGKWGASPYVQRAAFIWAAPFTMAEQFNRRVSFIAAYLTAQQEGMAEGPMEFAKRTVTETQGLYNKGNQANWARNPIGATVLTFKQFSVHYLEWMTRMYRSGPEGKRAVMYALAILIAVAGTDGLPFADDLDDLIDTLGQALGLDVNAKKARRDFVANTLGLGDVAADVAARGFSAMPGIPMDVSLRMSMGNLVPGTGMFLRSNTDRSRDVLELAGAAGGLVAQYVDAGEKALKGDMAGAALAATPVAIQNVGKAATMWTTGEARDKLDRKVMDTDFTDGLMRFMGFNPQAIARESEKLGMLRRSEQLAKNVEGEIAAAWARALADRDQDGVREAKQRLADWNEANPEQRIKITGGQILMRVRKLRQDRASRFITSTSPERRQATAEALQ